MNPFKRRDSERGAVIVMVAVWLPVLALFASFAIDVGHFFDYSRNLQNRADAAAIAAGLQFGDICSSNPTNGRTAPENGIGEMAQLFSGPLGSSSDLPYVYNGTGSPLDTSAATGPLAPFWAQAPSGMTVQYQNQPNLTVSNGSNGANYHVLLNADNYTPAGGANFGIGDFCNGNPTLDKTDRECFGKTNLTGQLATDCATGPMVDVKLTQSSLPLFFPLLGINPNISAHARVSLQSLVAASHLLPLAVGDAAYVPCVKVQFFPAGSSTPSTTIQLALNKPLTKSTGNPVWDNSADNSGNGDAVAIPAAGTYAYMQAILYSQGASGTCSTVRNSLTYPIGGSNDGVLYLGSYPATSLGTLANDAFPQIDTGGVTLNNGTGNPDQYFSSTGSGNYSVNVTAHVAFAANAGTTQVWAVDTQTGTKIQLNQQGSTNTWSGSGLSENALSGQHPICIQVNQANGIPNNQKSSCKGPAANGDYSLGVQQETFAACNEATDTCNNDKSGPIIQARIGQLTNQGGIPVVDWSTRGFAANSNPQVLVQLELQGLSDAVRYNPVTNTGDLCANNQCTILRLDNAGNGNGAIDCGEGNGASSMMGTMLNSCPLFGQTGTPSCVNASTNYCGTWTKTPDGTCNNLAARPAGSVDCVNTNNGGANIPTCVAALIQTGATVDTTNCNLKGNNTGCAVDHWLVGDAIPQGDPRVMSTFVVFTGDYINANGNTPVPIRDFAAFYVTGWKFNGQQVTCPTGLTPTQANEPPPASAAGANNAIWGHWITYTVPGIGGGNICDFQAFGECTPVLVR